MKITLATDHPVAVTSPDYLMPWGTRRDSSRNHRFIQKLSRLKRASSADFSILDLGCSGGGFVKDVIDCGWFAVGLEGSDHSKKMKRAEWGTIPDYLLTCDVTKPFWLSESASGSVSLTPLLFDVVTSWELLEHIAEDDLLPLSENVRRHLRPGGLWIVSISPNEEIIGGVRLHQTVNSQQWWLHKMSELGYFPLRELMKFFNGQYVRGPKFGAPGSFNLILSREPNQTGLLADTRLTVRAKLLDAWHGSSAQRLLQYLILGRTL